MDFPKISYVIIVTSVPTSISLRGRLHTPTKVGPLPPTRGPRDAIEVVLKKDPGIPLSYPGSSFRRFVIVKFH